jgi:hypothetical protein
MVGTLPLCKFPRAVPHREAFSLVKKLIPGKIIENISPSSKQKGPRNMDPVRGVKKEKRSTYR